MVSEEGERGNKWKNMHFIKEIISNLIDPNQLANFLREFFEINYFSTKNCSIGSRSQEEYTRRYHRVIAIEAVPKEEKLQKIAIIEKLFIRFNKRQQLPQRSKKNHLRFRKCYYQITRSSLSNTSAEK